MNKKLRRTKEQIMDIAEVIITRMIEHKPVDNGKGPRPIVSSDKIDMAIALYKEHKKYRKLNKKGWLYTMTDKVFDIICGEFDIINKPKTKIDKASLELIVRSITHTIVVTFIRGSRDSVDIDKLVNQFMEIKRLNYDPISSECNYITTTLAKSKIFTESPELNKVCKQYSDYIHNTYELLLTESVKITRDTLFKLGLSAMVHYSGYPTKVERDIGPFINNLTDQDDRDILKFLYSAKLSKDVLSMDDLVYGIVDIISHNFDIVEVEGKSTKQPPKTSKKQKTNIKKISGVEPLDCNEYGSIAEDGVIRYEESQQGDWLFKSIKAFEKKEGICYAVCEDGEVTSYEYKDFLEEATNNTDIARDCFSTIGDQNLHPETYMDDGIEEGWFVQCECSHLHTFDKCPKCGSTATIHDKKPKK